MFSDLLLCFGSEQASEDAAAGVADEGEGVEGFLLAGLQDGAEYDLRLAAGGGAVAAEDFAVDDGCFQRLLGAVIGRGNVRVQQEDKPVGGVLV